MTEEPVSLTGTVAGGDRVVSLKKLRDHLAARLETAEDERVIAPIAKTLADVMRELDQLQPPKREASPIDDLAAARAARREKAQASKRSPSGDQRRSGSRRPRKGSGSGA